LPEDALVASGLLRASDAPDGHFPLSSVAMSGGVLVAGAPDAAIGANQNQGAVYLFTEPAGGWSSETEQAKLVASDGRAGDGLGRLVAISGDTVVASSATAGTALYVFTKPPGGWSGTLHETARLTPTDPAVNDATSVAISGSTIVAGFPGGDGGLRAYVFTEPVGGWSGTIHESAMPTPSDASSCPHERGDLPIDGPTIVELGPYLNPGCRSGPAYVFTRPASGWSGTVQESATLQAPSRGLESVAVFGSTIVAGVAGPPYSPPADPVVFNEPASGWSGTVQPAARLNVSATGAGDQFDEDVAGSGDEIAALVIPESDICGIAYSCDDALYEFSRPPDGWSGTINGPTATAHVPDPTDGPGIAGPSDAIAIAIEGPTIASAGLGAVDLFTIPPGPPSIHSVSLAGLAIGRPRLHFALDAGHNAAPIRSFKLTLPNSLRFTNHRGSTRRLRTSVPGRSVTLPPRRLTMTLRRPAERLSVTSTPHAITERRGLIAQIRRVRRYNHTHRRKRTLTISVRCLVTDAAGHRTPFTLTTRIS
jgi:hypothetical protein